MKMEFVRIGDEFLTADGYIEIISKHDEDMWVTEFDHDGNEVADRLLTRSDLNRIVKEMDGQNHNFWLES